MSQYIRVRVGLGVGELCSDSKIGCFVIARKHRMILPYSGQNINLWMIYEIWMS